MFFSALPVLAKNRPTSFFSALVRIVVLGFLISQYTEASAQSLATDQVQYPNSAVAFICGPQLKAGSSLNPAPWFDSTARSMGITQGERNPRIVPVGPMWLDSASGAWQNVIIGRVGVSNGGLIVNGVGTAFQRDVDPGGSSPSYNGRMRIRDAGGVERVVQVRSVESDNSLTLMAPWGYGTVSNTVADTYYVDPNEGPNTDHYYSDSYYDTVLVQYINYYRTGEVKFLQYARKMADARWHSQWVGDGTITGGPNHLPVRSLAFAGLMLRAMDGRPEMWDYLEREVRTNFEVWVYLRKSNPTLFYDIREDGYAQLYAVLLAKVLPDSYPLYGNGTLQPSTGMATDGAAKRTKYLAQTEDAAVNFFGRLQRPDGSWRWDADTSSNPNEQYRDVEQPFMVGLYLESVVLLHQLSSNPMVKANLAQQLTRSVSHLYTDAYLGNATVTDFPQYRWRGMFYFWGGGTVANPTLYSPPDPSTSAQGDLMSWVRGTRHLNSTIHHAFGYAYHITGDLRYRAMGDEVFDASYGDQVDGLHSLADSGKGKDYAMHYRASGRYLVWRLEEAISPAPSPTPSPTATPTPTVLPTPTPNPSPSPSPANGVLTDMVWVEDALPAGSIPNLHGEKWNWVSASPSSYSGTAASQSSIAEGLHQHYFYGASATMAVSGGEVLFAYVYLDPNYPPSQIMLEWVDANGSWEHRAYWGSKNVPWGTDGTNSSRSMGPLPKTGGWTRLEVPANQVGLEGATVNGMAFTLFGGRATWDRAGKVMQISPLTPRIFTLSLTGIGEAVALNAATLTSGTFSVTTPQNLGSDKQTRLMIFASSLSSGVMNSNLGNDIVFSDGILPNVAESVIVEARTADNRTFQLPVEFVGPSRQSYDWDQVTVRLIGELRGAGNVQLTLIVAGQRSNTATVKLM
jgi:hypothetical protein